MATRRGFLGTIAAAVAAPAVGKIEEAVGNVPTATAVNVDWGPMPLGSRPIGIGAKPDMAKLQRFLRKNGLPDWKQREITAETTRYWDTRNLISHPDIEALRSVSPTHKRRMNIRKVTNRECDRVVTRGILEALGEESPMSKFYKKFGIWL